jgi:hypothetical protein
VIFNKGNICVFQSHEMRHLSLNFDNGMVSSSDFLRYRAHLCHAGWPSTFGFSALPSFGD